MMRSLAIALSLANLLFARAWLDLSRMWAEYPASAGSDTFRVTFLAIFAEVCVVFLAIAAILILARRSSSARLRLAAECGVVLLCTIPVDQLWRLAATRLVDSVPGMALNFIGALLLVLPICGCLFYVLFGARHLVTFVESALVTLTPLFLVQIATVLAWMAWAPAPARAVAAPQHGRPAARVVWVIFDELDYELAFERRPAGMQLPELDKLRAESLFATHALPPAMETQVSITRLLTGTRPRAVENTVVLLSDGRKVKLDTLPTIFSRLRVKRMNAAAVGWYLPYCAAFGRDLVACAEPTPDHRLPSDFGAAAFLRAELVVRANWIVDALHPAERMWSAWLDERQQQARAYSYMLDRALAMVGQPDLSLVFVHLPVPHPLGIFDRRSRSLSDSGRSNYLDNLVLVDVTLGKIRARLDESGLASSTALLVSADHPLIPPRWAKLGLWSDEEERAAKGRKGDRVPFLLRLPGTASPAEFQPSFNTVISAALAEAIIDGNLVTNEQLLSRLATDARSSRGSNTIH